MFINYDYGQNELKNWIIEERYFDPASQGKCEVIMSLGNGYMGGRSATEEKYIGQIRNHFVAGTFNKFDEHEVTELPNVADMSAIEIFIDGKRFSIDSGTYENYSRRLNLKNGELLREFNWTNNENKEFKFTFKRFISMDNLHLIGFFVSVEPLNCTADIEILSGIDAQLTNSGAQHFHEGEKRIYDKKFIELLQQTTESKVDVVHLATHTVYVDGIKDENEPTLWMDRRKVGIKIKQSLKQNQRLVLEKFGVIHTSRDNDLIKQNDLTSVREKALENIKQLAGSRFEDLLALSAENWQTKWDQMHITIKGADFEQLAIRFAHYQLNIFTPTHDNRLGIGAKGLSGEGYKGHSFWDTEIFMLPFFIYTMPKVARNLLTYRFNTLEGARRKAKQNGYLGAQFPWESALTGDEETPIWGAVDIITGESTKIWSGFIEQHITSDIAFAIWQYYAITGDEAFMDQMGYEMLFDTATFWTSRLEWLEDRQLWGINNVIGPDEYKEHIDNNAFTNYMAVKNIRLAIQFYESLKESKATLLAELDTKLNLAKNYQMWCERVEQIYLPEPRKGDKVIPQDDTYLSKQIIDLTHYKNQEQVGSLFDDYNLTQVNEMQISKQADLMILFLLLEDMFDKETKQANWDYYEPKTLHDSSLSLSTHSVLASDLGDKELAYELFMRAATIDIGQNKKSSDHGIHAASIGGLWQCIVYGFGGIRMLGGKLRIAPNLPDSWESLTFPIYWHNERLEIVVTHNSITITRVNIVNGELILEINGENKVITSEKECFNV